MSSVASASRRKMWVAAALLLAAVTASAHDIPASVVVQAYVRPQGDRLRVIVRAPLAAMRDVVFPLRDDGLLDFGRADAALRNAALTWLARDLSFYEGDSRLDAPNLVAARASLPSDRSFVTYDAALAHVTAAPLAPATTLYWNQALLDVLLEYPIRSDHSRFSVDPTLGRLGVHVVTVLRYQAPGGAERAFEYSGDPGLVHLDPRWHQAALQFVRRGFVHILSGTDHLLFLFCLVIPLRRVRPLVVVVTSFTVAHSITLIASAANIAPGALWFPPLIETLIAASIVYMALENIFGVSSVTRRWIITFAFGLVHGFGFSFALRETLQFAGSHLLTSLLAFNVGVELGQLLVLAVLAPVLALFFRSGVPERTGTIVLSAIVAHTAWHWMIDRWDRLRQFQAPSMDVFVLLTIVRWTFAAVFAAAVIWLIWPKLRMHMPKASRIAGIALFAAGLLWMAPRISGQQTAAKPFIASTAKGDWPSYTGDTRGTRYSPLDQINAKNFNDLEVAWRFKTDSLGSRPEYKLEGTPVVVNGRLYATAGTRRSVIALDAATGELLWVHRYPEGVRGANAPRQLSGRGLAYWTDGRGDERILYMTPGYRLIALNAKTGQPIPTFGKDGVVDLKVGVVYGTGQQIDLETGEIGVHSTPVIVKDTVLVGSAMKEGMTVHTSNNTKGLARAFDVRTGKLIWAFQTIPKPGEFGNETWLNNSWAINGNTGVWTQITVDEELGLVYLPVEDPTSDYYGGKRPGNNLFAESLVCVDLATGRRKWHFQFEHHPIWDHDISSAPIIADVTVNGRPRKVVAVPTKQAWLFVFDRVTGEPIWPIEEKPVPKGDVPGEWYSPTQPHPPAALMYGHNSVHFPDDLIDFTPELRAQAEKQIQRYKYYNDVVYNPPIVGDVNGTLGAITMGAANGGTNWPGGGYDPETHTVFVQAATASIGAESVAPPPEGFSDLAYQAGVVGQEFRERLAAGTGTYADAVTQPAGRGGGRGAPGRGAPPGTQPTNAAGAGITAGPAPGSGRGGRGGGGEGGLTVQGLPIIKPPYGVLAAIDLDQGQIRWRVPHGDTPDAVRNAPMLKGMTIPKTGQNVSVGLCVTKALVILGDGQFTTTDEHPRGAMLRAYDKTSGKEVGAIFMPAPQSGSPMTYSVNGRQFIVVAVSGGPYSGEYISYALPKEGQ